MDQRMKQYYSEELQHLRQMGREFALANPKIAGRLSLDSFEKDNVCPDPYVERLLEGFAFMAARVQLKIDAEFPEFTQHLFEIVYPHYLAPVPSMMVVQMQPEKTWPPDGVKVERHTILKSKLDPVQRGEQSRCVYRTAHEIKLYPIDIIDAEYLSGIGKIPEIVRHEFPKTDAFSAAIRLRLKTLGDQPFSQLKLDRLPLFLSGSGDLTGLLYEQLLADAVLVAATEPSARAQAFLGLTRQKPTRVGFSDDQALLPCGPQSFQGYRLLQEYFALPERFLFVELSDLADILKNAKGSELDVFILLKKTQPKLDARLNKSLFSLFCTPAVNLFPLPRADHIELTHTKPEYQVIPDRNRMADFEVYSVESVTAYGSGEDQVFQPFYSINSGYRHRVENAYYTLQRRKSPEPLRQNPNRQSTDYQGTDVYIALVDADTKKAPYDVKSLRGLRLQLLCTNRDLTHKKRNQFNEFDLDVDVKVESTRCVTGPTDPRPSPVVSGTAWRLLSHLSLNYLSLVDTEKGAAALRELLSLYCDPADEGMLKQIDGLRSVTSKPAVRRIDSKGPIVFGRGIEVTVQFDEACFEGGSYFLLGAVLERFFARYVSLNSFIETVIATDKREIMRWPIRTGQRQIL